MCWVLKRGISPEFLVTYDDFCGIILNRNSNYSFSKVLKNEFSFLNQTLISGNCKLDSWYIFSFEVPGTASVIPIQALYCFIFLGFDKIMHYRLSHKEYHHNLDGVLQILRI